MKNDGYYEIRANQAFGVELKATVLAGNIQFNRLHWHDHLEILSCVHGGCRVRMEGTVYPMGEGDLLTIPGGVSHELFDGTADELMIVVSIDPSLLRKKETEQYAFSTVGEEALDRDSEEICAVRRSIGRMAWLLTPEKEELLAYRVRGPFAETTKDRPVLRTEEEWDCYHMELYHVLMQLARHKKQAKCRQNASVQDSLFAGCIQILHREYGQPLDAKKLAGRIGVSEPTLYRMFRRNLGVSFVDYLNLIRVNAACGLLENTELGITEIAERCGFTSLSNFYRLFRLHMGQTPREYRMKNGNLKWNGRPAGQEIMELNRFLSFWELGYEKEELL